MNRGFSIYLDAVRFLAAFLVVLSHLAYPRFTGDTLSFLRAWDYGRDAVILFFILSGLVIAYVADRDGSWQRYMFNRLTRLFSVMVPALFITFLADRLGSTYSPGAYDDWWYAPLPAWEFLAHGITFTNEWLTGPIRLGTNGPLWSLSYEVAYYLLFGIAFYLKGHQRLLLLLAAALLAGPRVLLLLPVWLLGVWVWHTVGKAQIYTTKLAAGLMVVLFPALYIGASTVGLNSLLAATGSSLLSQAFPALTQAFSSAYLWNFLLGAFFALHLVGMAKLLENRHIPTAASKAIRWLAGASFTIYVLHYPLLQFVHALLPTGLQNNAVLLLGIVLALCFGIAELTERRLKGLRDLLLVARTRYAEKT